MKQTDNFKFDEANVMNELVYRNLSEDAKRQICAWKYGGEYDLYNLPAYEEMQVRQIGFMNPQREKNYYGFWDESILVGFVNIFEEKELEEYLEKGIQDEILLPVKKGRQVIYDMVKSGICIIYKFRSKEEEEVMQKLYDFKTGEGQKS